MGEVIRLFEKQEAAVAETSLDRHQRKRGRNAMRRALQCLDPYLIQGDVRACAEALTAALNMRSPEDDE